MHRLVVSVFVLSIAFGAQAAPSSEDAAMGLKLATLLDYESLFTKFRAQCEHPDGTLFDPKELVRANPNAFGGLRPSSKQWPQVESAYASYRSVVCAAAAPRNLNLFVGNALAQELSTEDLRAAVAFYSSKAGQRFQRANSGANESLRSHIEQSLNSSQSDAYKQLAVKLQAAMTEYQKNPK